MMVLKFKNYEIILFLAIALYFTIVTLLQIPITAPSLNQGTLIKFLGELES